MSIEGEEAEFVENHYLTEIKRRIREVRMREADNRSCEKESWLVRQNNA